MSIEENKAVISRWIDARNTNEQPWRFLLKTGKIV